MLSRWKGERACRMPSRELFSQPSPTNKTAQRRRWGSGRWSTAAFGCSPRPPPAGSSQTGEAGRRCRPESRPPRAGLPGPAAGRWGSRTPLWAGCKSRCGCPRPPRAAGSPKSSPPGAAGRQAGTGSDTRQLPLGDGPPGHLVARGHRAALANLDGHIVPRVDDTQAHSRLPPPSKVAMCPATVWSSPGYWVKSSPQMVSSPKKLSTVPPSRK